MTRIRSLILNDSDVRSVLQGTKRMHAVAVRREKAPSPGYGAAPYQVGDMVWVREAFADSDERVPHYRADFDRVFSAWFRHTTTHGHVTVYKWRPATNMRRDESRLTLRVTDVSVERDEGGQWTWMVAFERVGGEA